MPRFDCPECGAKINAPEQKAGKAAICPGCKKPIIVPDNRPKEQDFQSSPPPVRRETADPFADMAPEQVVVPQESSMPTGDRVIVINQAERTDAPGVVSLIIGGFAAISLLLACCTYGLSLLATAPVAAIGFCLALMARGNLRVASLMINGMALLPALIGVILVVFFFGIGTLASMLSDSKQPQPMVLPTYFNER